MLVVHETEVGVSVGVGDGLCDPSVSVSCIGGRLYFRKVNPSVTVNGALEIKGLPGVASGVFESYSTEGNCFICIQTHPVVVTVNKSTVVSFEIAVKRHFDRAAVVDPSVVILTAEGGTGEFIACYGVLGFGEVELTAEVVACCDQGFNGEGVSSFCGWV